MSFLLLTIVGIFTGILSGITGLGGGFIVSPILLYLIPSLTPTDVSILSILYIFFTSMLITFVNIFKGRIYTKPLIGFFIGSLGGSFAGRILVEYLSLKIFIILFITLGTFFSITSIVQTFFRDDKKYKGNYDFQLKDILLLTLLGFIIDALSSVVGLGGGMLYSNVLIFLYNVPPIIGAPTTSSAVLINRLLTILAEIIIRGPHFLALLKRTFTVLLPIVLGGMIGAFIGTSVLEKIEPKNVKIVLITFTIFVVILSLLKIIK